MQQSSFVPRWRGYAFALSAATLVFSSGHALSQQQLPPNYAFQVVHVFKGPSDAAFPWAGVVRGKDGNLYGTSWAGGSYPGCSGGLGVGCGAIFRLDSSGKTKVIYSFSGTPGPIHLYGELLAAADGTLYGLTDEGGSAAYCYGGGGNGCGTVFKLDESGELNVLYNFGTNGGAGDGLHPAGDLVKDSAGNLYGTTLNGGLGDNGTIFEVTKSGQESVLYRFTGGADGSAPSSSLVRDSSGNLYGMASGGGGACGGGTVFKLDASGNFSVLYTFRCGRDGGTPSPLGGIIRDAAGKLCGTTDYFGDAGCFGGTGCEVVFKLSPSGKETVLHAFEDSPDGRTPVSRLTMDKAGNLFGTTMWGGKLDDLCTFGSPSTCGVVFEVTTSGKERVLHAFDGTHGMYPWGRVFVDGSGNLVGTAWEGGRFGVCANGCGVLYMLSR
jgi:uncharacterized repeat protein (TIGR03803 family)